MVASWRHAYANVVLTGGNLVFLLIALKSPTAAGIGLASGLIGTTSLYAWYVNLRRFRAVADTPTSRVSSAPQGYVELVGKGSHPPGNKLVSPLSGLPCLWYRYLIEERNGNKWRRIGSGVSSETFGLHDGTGMALIDPDGAEVITSNKRVTIKDRYRETEWTLIEGGILYVLGEHVTVGGANAVLDPHQDVSDLLADWKRNKKQLLSRFDLDGNSSISLDEWERARHAAQRQVELEHGRIRLESGTRLVRKPQDRMFLIANRTPESMAARYRFWAWAHLGLLAAACSSAALLL
jgi:F0F1-type ATP synthase epsilon subunit